MKLSSSILSALLTCLLALLVLFGPISAISAYAQDTNENIETQRVVVLEHLAGTLQEYVKLLQLTVIERLEARVVELEAQLAAQ